MKREVNFTLKVTKIEVQKKNKNKVNIYCDEEYLFSLHTETLLKNHISVGSILRDEMVENLVKLDNRVKALEYATKYVEKGLKSRKQVRDYLKKKDYEVDIIHDVIEKLETYSLIDDETYIKAFIHDHNQYGQLKLKQQLMEKGISKNKLDEYFLDYEQDLEVLQNIANKYLKGKEKTYENIIKCKKYLLSHGFGYEDISKLDWGNSDEDWN